MKKCSDVMTRDVVCCLPSDTVARAAQTMKSEDVGTIPVVEDQQSKKLIGVITDRDLAIKVVAEGRDPNTTRIEHVMTRNPITCRAEDDLQKALDAMARHQVRRIPVAGPGNRIVGIIAQADIATRSGEREKTAEVIEKISQPSALAA